MLSGSECPPESDDFPAGLLRYGVTPALIRSVYGKDHYDMRKQEQSFEPKLNEDHFDGFWCNGRQWGVVHQRKDNDGTLYQTTEVLYDAVKM